MGWQETLISLAAGALGGTLVLFGGFFQRRWEERRAAAQAKVNAYMQLLTVPLIFDFDCHMLTTLKRYRMHNLLRLNRSLEVMRDDLSKIVEAFTTCCRIGAPREVRAAGKIMAACQGLAELVEQDQPSADDVKRTRADLSRARLDFLDLVRLDAGSKENIRQVLDLRPQPDGDASQTRDS